MRQSIRALAAAGLAWLASTAGPAAAQAQTVEQQWTNCKSVDGPNGAEGAIAACTAVIQSGRVTGRNLSIAYQARANIYDDNARYPQAMADYDQAVRLDPQSAMAHYNRGLSLRRQGKLALALADYDEAIRLNPQFAEAFNNRGNVHAAQGRYSQAIADSREALRLKPRYPSAQSNLCLFMVVSGSPLPAARVECDLAVEILPNDPKALAAHATLGLKQGRYQEAWNGYDKALGLDPKASTNATAIYGRGIAASRLGRAADARADLTRATAVDGGIALYFSRMGLTPKP